MLNTITNTHQKFSVTKHFLRQQVKHILGKSHQGETKEMLNYCDFVSKNAKEKQEPTNLKIGYIIL